MNSGGGIAALFFAIGVLLLFAFGFAFFLVVPFFVFLAGIVAMFISDRKREPGEVADRKADQEDAKRTEVAG
jgi:uncharacterized membrane protein